MTRISDTLRALEYVDEIAAQYQAAMASAEAAKVDADYNTRAELDNYISAAGATVQRLRFIHGVLVFSTRSKPRRRRPRS